MTTSLARAALALIGIVLVGPLARAADPDPLRTHAEATDFRETGRMEEVYRLADAFVRAFPGKVRRLDFGVTPEGRTMTALVASGSGNLQSSTHPSFPWKIVFQGGIHAGEIDGKDAGFIALRDLLEGKVAAEAFQAVTVIFVPVFNVDGHERFGAHNRPNQSGPREMGWRTTAANLNLNRDYAKAETPEMHAMLRLLNEWDPLVYVDLHVTDGADFQPDIAVIVDPAEAGPSALRTVAREFRDGVLGRLKANGHPLALPYYPSFLRDDDPLSGFAVSSFTPRFSNGYWAARDRVGVLVETHSWKDYRTRVKATRDAIVAIVEEMRAANERQLMKGHILRGWQLNLTQIGREAGAVPYERRVPLTFEPSGSTSTIDFPGYAYTRGPSSVSGVTVTAYDPKTPQVWRVPLHDELVPGLTVSSPQGGYIVPQAWANLVRSKLELHGMWVTAVATALPALEVETFRAASVTFAASPFEGRQRVDLGGAWARERRDIPAGSLFVPIEQHHPRLLLHLLEPTAPDSLAAWGFFNACFERKEYMEAYVAETIAREMLQDPAVAAEFKKRLESDPAFAKDPAARLDFFYRRHPSWDERLNLYPIYRTEGRLQ